MKTPVVTIVACGLLLAGCGNLSRRALTRQLEQSESLAIFLVPDDCRADFQPSRKLNLDSTLRGISEGGADGIKALQDLPPEPYTLTLIASFYLPYKVASGGISNAARQPRILTTHFRDTLDNTFQDTNPGDRIAEHIQTAAAEQIPNLQSRRIRWTQAQCDEYRNAAPENQKAAIRQFCKTTDPAGEEILLQIRTIEYGLAGATMKNVASYFFMTVQADVVRRRDGRRLYRRKFKYQSPFRSVGDWESNAAHGLRTEFDRGCRDLSHRIWSQLQENTTPRHAKTPSKSDATKRTVCAK